MNLKESFNYMNFLESKLSTCKRMLGSKDFTTTTTIKHYKKDTIDTLENTEEEIKKSSIFDGFEANKIVSLMMRLMSEQEKLAKAISKAKRESKIDIDATLEINNKERRVLDVLKDLNNLKSSENIDNETVGYTFNAEGNQTRFYYKSKKITTIDYDRNETKKLFKSLNKACEDRSNAIELAMLQTEVEFEPKWETTDELEDMLD